MFRAPSIGYGTGRPYTDADVAAVRQDARQRLAHVKRKAADAMIAIERAAVDMQNGFRLREQGKISRAQAMALGKNYENAIKVYDRQFDRDRSAAIDQVRTIARTKRVPLGLVPELEQIKALVAPWGKG